MEQNLQENVQKIKLPKNVRQIGTIDQTSRIYMEDYVVTYLDRMAKKQDLAFGVAALYGRCVSEGTEKYVFISAAVFAEDVPSDKKGEKDTIEYGPTRHMTELFREKGETFFQDLSPVGIAVLHKDSKKVPPAFTNKSVVSRWVGRGQVYIDVNIEEGQSDFYLYTEKGIEARDGHYIYYDKNDRMQSFLVEWHEKEEPEMHVPEEDHAAESCRLIMKDKQENRRQSFLDTCFSASSLLALIAICMVGIVMMNYYQKNGKDAVMASSGEVQPAVITVSGNAENDLDEQEPVPRYEEPAAGFAAEEADAETVSENADAQVSENEERNEANISETENEEIAEYSNIGDGTVSDNGQTDDLEIISETENQEDISMEANEAGIFTEYVIEKGDTLYEISRRYYGTESRVAEICEMNGIENQDSIYYGQIIILPGE